MARGFVLAVLAALAGCVHASTEPPREVAVAPTPTIVPVVSPAETTPPQPPPPEPLPPCIYKAEPPALPPVLKQPKTGTCRRAPPAITRAMNAEIHKQWLREWPTGRLEIRPGCDRLAPALASVVIEQNHGHGGSVSLLRLSRRPDGDHDLVLIEYNHYYRMDTMTAAGARPIDIHHAKIAAATVAPLLARLRAAAHVEIQEHEPPPDSNAAMMGHGSSNDYQVALQLADDRGHGVKRAFVGYSGSGPEQADGVPLAIAAETVDLFLADPTLRATFTAVGTDDPAARDLFARVFWAVQARQEGDAAWYVRERLIAMAASLGSAQHIPALLALLREPPGRPGEDRMLVSAIDALTAITAYDRRRDPDGTLRPPEQVAAELLAACAAPTAQ